MFDLILFDLDGTLIESAPEITDAVNAWMRQRGMPEHPPEAVLPWIGQGSRELMIQAYCAATGTTPGRLRADPRVEALMAEFSDHYAAHSGRNSALYPGVRAGLAQLRAAGIRLAVVTNKYARYTAPALAAHGLGPFFDLVLSGDSLPTCKPDAGPILHCLAHFDVAPARALFVGDSEVDVAAARAAGIAIWAVPYGYNGGRPVSQAAPDRVLRDFEELVSRV